MSDPGVDVVQTDVLVVGAGVTGLTLAAILAGEGVDAVCIARHPGTAPQPRAQVTNMRTMEVFRDLGIEERVESVGVSLRTVNHNVMATSFAGQEISRYTSYGTDDRLSEYLAASPCTPFSAPQHVLEPVLAQAVVDRGGAVRFHHELLTITQSNDGVVARVRNRDTGEEYEVRARYAVGADGARSRVAEQLGFRFTGRAALKHMANAWVAADLSEHTAHRPGVFYSIVQPRTDRTWAGSGAFLCVRPWDEWVLVREYDPEPGDPDLSETAVVAAVRQMAGIPDLPVEVRGVSTWQVNHVVADEYQVGRVFLAGDAAHRHPPSGGLGSNTGIQDAWNLGWKLALVVKGLAGESLLASYDQERQPVGRQVVDRAIASLENLSTPIGVALGQRPGMTAEEGWAAIAELAADTPEAAERRRVLAEAVALQNYRSNALGVELGQRCRSDAVVDDGTPFPSPARDEELHYEPTTHPGATLPHAWIEHGRTRLSTLDLAGHGRFCLIVGVGGQAWSDAAAEVAAKLGLELPVFAVGYRLEFDDVLGTWQKLREVGDSGVLLVRPDRVVGWRATDRSERPFEDLWAAVTQVLALDQQLGEGGEQAPIAADALTSGS